MYHVILFAFNTMFGFWKYKIVSQWGNHLSYTDPQFIGKYMYLLTYGVLLERPCP